MDVVLIFLIVPFLLLLILGVPIAFALGVSSIVYILFSGTPMPMLMIATELYSGVDSVALLALPLFVLVGEMLNKSSISDKIVDVATVSVGWLRGGLAQVCVVASMFFAGIAGSALAEAASIGSLLIPQMVKCKYPKGFAAALVGSAAVIGPIIPPSVPMIVVGGNLNISLGGMFMGGVMPGIAFGLGLMLVSYVISVRNNYGGSTPFPGFWKTCKVIFIGLPALFAPVIILIGKMTGAFTPTEAGAIASLYCFILGIFFYRTLTFKAICEALKGCARVTGSCLIIVACAMVFSRILTYHKVPQAVMTMLMSISSNPIIILLIIIIALLIMGMFMDAVANMIILGPLLMPVCTQALGMDPIHFGVFLVITLCIGLITPPLGMCLLVVAPIARVRFEETVKSVIPFLLCEIFISFIVAYWPPLVMWLPKKLGF